jgi:RNA polymerase sigma-70 factor (ECF subfamily)
MENSFQQLSDEELVAKAVENHLAFKDLMSRYKEKLFYYIIRLGHLNQDDAEDVLQKTFINIYRHLNDFDNGLKFSSWAYRIAHNETVSELRRRHHSDENLEDQLNTLKDLTDIQNEIDHDLQAEEIKKILNCLDEKYREVLVLKYFEHKDYAEISDILQKPMGTVATLINRAKKQFKDNHQIYVRKN